MKILSTNNFNLNMPSANTTKNASKTDQKDNIVFTSNRRFDIFTMSGTTGKTDDSDNVKKLDAKTAELVRSLSALSAEDKTELAFDSYLDMQKSLHYIKDMVEFQAECFKDLRDKKAYYTDLLNSNCIVEEERGKYKFSDYSQGSMINSDDVYNALQKTQKSLDSLCGKAKEEDTEPKPLPEHVVDYITYEEQYNRAEMMFRSAATVFSAVTGISDSALEIESGELYFDKEGVNEENFLEKANSLLNAITDRSKKLGDIMSEYSYNHRHLMDKLKERLELAEKQEEKKDVSIAKMIAQYDEYLNKVYGKFNI